MTGPPDWPHTVLDLLSYLAGASEEYVRARSSLRLTIQAISQRLCNFEGEDRVKLHAALFAAEALYLEQEKLWSEMFRICKPGGSIEIIVPNLEWAARKIAAGEVDTHVLSVLYGSQELGSEVFLGVPADLLQGEEAHYSSMGANLEQYERLLGTGRRAPSV